MQFCKLAFTILWSLITLCSYGQLHLFSAKDITSAYITDTCGNHIVYVELPQDDSALREYLMNNVIMYYGWDSATHSGIIDQVKGEVNYTIGGCETRSPSGEYSILYSGKKYISYYVQDHWKGDIEYKVIDRKSKRVVDLDHFYSWTQLDSILNYIQDLQDSTLSKYLMSVDELINDYPLNDPRFSFEKPENILPYHFTSNFYIDGDSLYFVVQYLNLDVDYLANELEGLVEFDRCPTSRCLQALLPYVYSADNLLLYPVKYK